MIASTSCQSPQEKENARRNRLQTQIVESGRRHFAERMKKLHAGMKVREVEEIIGPIDNNYLTLMVALIERRQTGMRITFENGEKGGMHVFDDPPDGHLKSLYTYHGNGFTLVFDWNGLLKEFCVD